MMTPSKDIKNSNGRFVKKDLLIMLLLLIVGWSLATGAEHLFGNVGDQKVAIQKNTETIGQFKTDIAVMKADLKHIQATVNKIDKRLSP